MNQSEAPPSPGADEGRVLSVAPERVTWDVLSVPCKGPCWNARWYVFQRRGFDVGDYYTNESGSVKRFRSEAAARGVANKLNRGAQ